MTIDPPSQVTGSRGTTLNYSATLQNNDALTCPAIQFRFRISPQDPRWEWQVTPPVITLSPQTSGSVAIAVTSRMETPLGQHLFQVYAQDPSRSRTGGAGMKATIDDGSCIFNIPSAHLNPQSFESTSPSTPGVYDLSVSSNDLNCGYATYTFFPALLDGSGRPLTNGWSASVSPPTIVVGPGTLGTARVVLKPPPNITNNYYYPNLVAAAPNHPSGYFQLSYVLDTTKATPTPTPSVSPSPTPTAVPTPTPNPNCIPIEAKLTLQEWHVFVPNPSTSGHYDVTVVNRDWNCGPTTFTIVPILPAGWSYTLSQPTVTIASNESQSFNLVVTPAANAIDNQYNLLVTATAPNHPTGSQPVWFTIDHQMFYPPCDIDKDWQTNITDIQVLVNEILGVNYCTGDLDRSGVCDVQDLQRVVNAVLGGTCVIVP